MLKFKNFTRKRKISIVLSVFLGLAILVSGALAYLTATDTKTNKFAFGDIDIELWENFDTDKDGEINPQTEVFDGDVSGDDERLLVKGLMPLQSVIKAPWVKNTGTNPVYAFIMVGIPKDTYVKAGDGGLVINEDEVPSEVLSVMYNDSMGINTSDWVLVDACSDAISAQDSVYSAESAAKAVGDEYNYYVYGYKYILNTGDGENETSKLFNKVVMDDIVITDGNQSDLFGPYKIPLVAFAVQSVSDGGGENNTFENVTEAWKEYKKTTLSEIFPDTPRKDRYEVTYKYADEILDTDYYGTRRTFNVNKPANIPEVPQLTSAVRKVWVNSKTGDVVEIGPDPVINDLLPKRGGAVTDYWPVLNCYAFDSTKSGITEINISSPVLSDGRYTANVSVFTNSNTENIALFADITDFERSVYSYPDNFSEIPEVCSNVKLFANKNDNAFTGNGFKFLGRQDGPDNTVKYSFELVCGSINDKRGEIAIANAYAAVGGNGIQYFVPCSNLPAPFEFVRPFDNTIESVEFSDCTNPWTIKKFEDGFWGGSYDFWLATGNGVNKIHVIAYSLDGAPLYEETFTETSVKDRTDSTTRWKIELRNKIGAIRPEDAKSSVTPGHAADSPRGCYFTIAAIHEENGIRTNPENPVKTVVYYIVADANTQTVLCGENEMMYVTKDNPDYANPSAHRYYFIQGILDN